MAQLTKGYFDSLRSVNAQTLQKQNRDFIRWKKFLERSGIYDQFLESFTEKTKIAIVSAFLASIRRNENGSTGKDKLTGGTISSILNNVCATFRSNLWRDPSLDQSGNRALTIQRQTKGYKKEDGAVNHQKCLPLQVFKSIYNNRFSPEDEAMGQLITGALFFGMRSCEYSLVKGERKTKLLLIRNIQFFKNKKEIKKTKTSTNLYEARTVSITFITQKNNKKNSTVSMHSNNARLCPVKIWASLVSRILSHEGGSIDLPVCTFFSNSGKMTLISSKKILQHIRTTVKIMGEDNLGFKANEVGCHSIRSSFAMFLYLQKVLPDRIMLQGRWDSDAFLLYIRPQVAVFSKGLSAAITNDTNNFFTVPDINSQSRSNIRSPMFNFDIVTNPEDPRTRNRNSFASHLNNNGPGANNPRVTRPSFFHLYS